MATVFLAMVHDNHTDPYAEPFTTAAAAINFARTTAHRYGSPGTYRETTVPGWLFTVHYGPEGDSVWVVEKELRTS